MDINVDMEIKEMDPVAGQEFARAGKHNAMYYGGDTANKPPRISIENHMTGFWMNVSYNNDSTYDAMVTDKFKRATDLSEAKKVLIELDKYYLQAHWNVITFPTVNNVFWQPFLKGYSGELLQWGHGIYVARWWIDQSLKK